MDDLLYFLKVRSGNPYNFNCGYKYKSTDMEVYHDYREYTVVDRVIEVLLEYRKIWKRTFVPWDHRYIQFSFVGTDIAITPKFLSSLKMVDSDGNVSETFEVSMKKVFEENKEELIDLYEQKIEKLRNAEFSQELMLSPQNQVTFNKLVMSRSQVSNRLTQITRWAGDKALLYSMMRSYGGGKFVPITFEVDVDNEENIQNLLQTKLKEGSYWVVKPTSGSRGVGMQFASTNEVLENFLSWSNSVYDVKSEPKKFSKWLISEFKKSFLWKLNNDCPDSLRLCRYKYTNSNGVVFNEKLPDKPPKLQIFDLWNKCKVLGVYDKDGETGGGQYIIQEKIKENYYTHKFTDTIGRINKARVWFAISVEEDHYNIHVYNKILFEVCSKEFKEDYSDKMQVWTDISDEYYQEQYGMDNVNSARAVDLDLCHVVDWDNGLVGVGMNWIKVRSNLKKFMESFMNAVKFRISCLSSMHEYSKGCFQYFGMDFIVDSNNDVWLLELNTRPWIGYGNWWNKFDPDNVHIPHKWLFLESLLRKFLDPKFERKPEKLPYDKDLKGCKWVHVSRSDFSSVKDPVAVIQKSIPSKGQSNWVMSREMIRVILSRGLSIFPYGKLIKKPELYLQGMTPYITYLINKVKGNLPKFKKHIDKMYPDLVKADVVNRIFPFVYYLGNKVVLTDILKEFYDAPGGASPNSQWLKDNGFVQNQLKPFDIIPASFTIQKSNPNWIMELMDDIEDYENGSPKRWIVKPAMGKQGTGIFITPGELEDRADLDAIVRHILTDPDNQEENDWVISLYIDNPLLFMDRKSHIRIFVLVHNDGKGVVNYLMMDPPLLFLAGLPYRRDSDFYNSFFSEQGKELARAASSPGEPLRAVEKYKNLTNLAKGKELFLTYVKKPSEQVVGYVDETEVEKKLQKQNVWFKEDGSLNPDFGYKVLSYDASKKCENYKEIIEPKIKDLIVHTLYAVKDHVGCVNNGGCYHYLAFDIMVDDTNHPWLLEVNVNPGLQAIKNVVKGGMKNFFNNIFYHVTSGQNLKVVSVKKPQVWKKDGIHWEKWESGEKPEGSVEKQDKTWWYPVQHEEGDIKTYRYSKKKNGVEYNDEGVQRDSYNTDKEWKKGEPLKGNEDGEYFVPEQYRKYDNSWLIDNRKLIKKHEELFKPILKVLKSEQRVNIMATKPSDDEKKPSIEENNPIVIHLAKLLERVGLREVTIKSDKGEEKTWVSPRVAFALKLAASMEKTKDDAKDKTLEDALADYYKSVFGLLGYSKPSSQLIPFYLKKIFGPIHKGYFRGNSLSDILYYNAIFNTWTPDKRKIEIIVKDEPKGSSFGENITIEGVPLNGNMLAAIYDAQAAQDNAMYRNHGWGLGFNVLGVPILPSPDPEFFEHCENTPGEGVRGYDRPCNLDNPLRCTEDRLRSSMKRLGIPSDLVNRMPNKNALECLLNSYAMSGFIGIDYLSDLHPMKNNGLLGMFGLLKAMGVDSMPFKGYLNSMRSNREMYNYLIKNLNMNRGQGFYSVALPGGQTLTI